MSETAAQRELARQVARLDREARRPIDVAVAHCVQHGPQYACMNSQVRPLFWKSDTPQPRCDHIACRQIVAGNCPECETP